MSKSSAFQVRDLGTIFDGPHATPGRTDEGPYFLNIASLRSGRLDLSESDHVTPEDYDRWTRRVAPQAGDLLFSYETRLGEAALMPAGVKACLGRRMALLRPNPAVVSPRFLLYFYLSPIFQRLIEQHTVHGATVNRIGLSTMGDWPIELPGLPEQRAIAEVLGALDDKIAANARLAETSLSLGDARFSGGSVASATATLGELADMGSLMFGDGYRTKKSELGSFGLRILRAGDIRQGRVHPTGGDRVSSSFTRQIGQRASQPGDIVLTTKGTVGRVAVVPPDIEQVVYSPQLCYFRVTDGANLHAGHLAAWFRSPDLQHQAAVRMFKSDMAPHINLQDIRSLCLPVPPMEVQQRVGEIQQGLLGVHDSACAENRQLRSVRDTLLPELVSGRIRVKDAVQIVGEVI